LRVVDYRFGGVAGIERERRPDAQCQPLLVDDDAGDALANRDHAQFGDRDEIGERLGQRPEAVAHAGHDLVDILERARRGELLVDRDLLRDLRDVVVGDEGVEFDVDDGFTLGLALGERTSAFGDRIGEQLDVRLETDGADEPGLRRTQQIARAANLEIAHRDLQSRTQMGEFADRFQARLGVFAERQMRRRG